MKADITREEVIAKGKASLISAMEHLEKSKNLLIKVLKVDEEVLNDWCSEKHAEISRKYREYSAAELMMSITTDIIEKLISRQEGNDGEETC